MELKLQSSSAHDDALLIHSCVAVTDNDGDSGGGHCRIRIADAWYARSLILTPQAVALWEVADAAELTVAHFEHLAALGAEVVILGTGARGGFPNAALTQPLMRRRIGLEAMDTAAACRTYNILVGDGRRAVAALII